MLKKIKSLLRPMIDKTLSNEVMLRFSRKSLLRNKTIVLMYHELGEDLDDIDAWTVVKTGDFVRQMEYLIKNFQIVSLAEAIDKMESRKNLSKPLAVITFDDGYSGNKRLLLPILESFDIPATMFVATQFIQDQCLFWYDEVILALQGVKTASFSHPLLGHYRFSHGKGKRRWSEIEMLLRGLKSLEPDVRQGVVREVVRDLEPPDQRHRSCIQPLTISELQELAKSPHITIGAHSHYHDVLTQLSAAEVGETVDASKQLLESWTGNPVHYFAYPHGDYNQRVAEILNHRGFACAVTTDAKPWSRGESLLMIPRIRVGRYDSFDSFKLKISKGFGDIHVLKSGFKRIFQRSRAA